MSSLNKVILYCDDKLSLTQIAALCGEPISRVRMQLLRDGVAMRGASESIKLRMPTRRRTPRGPMSAESKQRMSAARLRWADKNAVGTSVKPSGYVVYTRGPYKGKTVHTVVMEERIGRMLLSDEVVHHIDGNRQNNDPNNLALMTRSAHSRLHRREDVIAGNTRERTENGRFA